jgi:hypothetical protein
MSEDKTDEELEGRLSVDVDLPNVIFPDDPKWIPFGAVERAIERFQYFPQIRTYLPNVVDILAQQPGYLQKQKDLKTNSI